MSNFIKLISTFFYSGYVPKVPGTFGTFTALIFYYFIILFFNPPSLQLALITLLIVFISIIFSHYSIKIFNSDDPPKVVIDEVAGFFVALLFIPFSILNLFSAFVLFRLFDIWKPYPINYVDDNVKGALGIMLDDILASVYSIITLIVIFFFLGG